MRAPPLTTAPPVLNPGPHDSAGQSQDHASASVDHGTSSPQSSSCQPDGHVRHVGEQVQAVIGNRSHSCGSCSNGVSGKGDGSGRCSGYEPGPGGGHVGDSCRGSTNKVGASTDGVTGEAGDGARCPDYSIGSGLEGTGGESYRSARHL